jgi:hypothetical protein
MNTTVFRSWVAWVGGLLMYGLLFVMPVHGVTLVNLTTTGATETAGDIQCPEQMHFHYSGGKRDIFVGSGDFAYPSLNLAAFMAVTPSVQGVVGYDAPMDGGHFGESFNLKNTRSVCYALIQFRVENSGAVPGDDTLTVGHVENDGSFTLVAQVLDPGSFSHPDTSVQTYAFDATALGLLSDLTGVNLDRTPPESILDIFLQDDTKIDFVDMFVWYGPNCSEGSTPTPDTDGDGVADCADPDDDNDGASDVDEATAGSDPLNTASTPEICDGVDNDLDGTVDEGFPDTDNDGVADCVDLDTPELCDGFDNDLDGLVDEDFPDTDADGVADCVDADDDGDGLPDSADNCPLLVNPGQEETDVDGVGDLCDPTPLGECGGLPVTLRGTSGNDILNGTAGVDVMEGLDGDDTLGGLGGDDTLCGGLGDDNLFGASGNDTLDGGAGTDFCRGGTNTDTATGCETMTEVP